MPLDRSTNLCWSLAKLSLLIGEQPLLGAGRAFCPVQALEATAQTCMAQSAVAAAIAGQLVQHARNLRGILVDVNLPRVAEVLPGKFGSAQNGRKGTDFQRSRGVVRRNIIGRIGPLCVADGSSARKYKGESPAPEIPILHDNSWFHNYSKLHNSSWFHNSFWLVYSSAGEQTKKDGTNVFCSCREASDATYLLSKMGDSCHPRLQYLHLTIDSRECKYQNPNILTPRRSKLDTTCTSGAR